MVVSENELRRTTTAERSSVLLIRSIIYLASYLACDCPVLGRRGYEYVHGGAVVVEVWRVTKQTAAKGGVFSVVTKNKKCVIGGAEATSDRNRKGRPKFPLITIHQRQDPTNETPKSKPQTQRRPTPRLAACSEPPVGSANDQQALQAQAEHSRGRHRKACAKFKRAVSGATEWAGW